MTNALLKVENEIGIVRAWQIITDADLFGRE